MEEEIGQENAEATDAGSLKELQPEDIIRQAKEAVGVMRKIDKLRRKRAQAHNNTLKTKAKNRAINKSARKARKKNKK